MCNYCGCREFAEIAALTDEHVVIINTSGTLHRAVMTGDARAVEAARTEVSAQLHPHTQREERGLFAQLRRIPDVESHVADLCAEHRELDALLDAVSVGDEASYQRFETPLRHHIDREENGLFPSAVIELAPSAWELVEAANAERPH